MTAYHEATHQPRAKIDLAKAVKLIDDRSSLTQPDPKSKSRRKSAFSEEEEGYMYVEEGFRIRFANGEVIDFYADNAAQKDGWMKVLGEAIGRDAAGKAKGWARIVLDKERAERSAAGNGNAPSGHHHSKTRSEPNAHMGNPSKASRSVPSSPTKSHRTGPPATAAPPPPIEKDPRHSMVSPPPKNPRTPRSGRRDQVKSMVY